jgi:hypothetical protein
MSNELEQNAKSILDSFISKIDDWINLNGFNIKPKIDIENAESIIEITDFTDYKYEALMAMSFVLVSYANQLQDASNMEQVIFDFCESSISYITCDIEMEGDAKYLKHEERYAFKVKQNKLSIELNRLKNICGSRLKAISYKIEYVRKMADIIQDIAKRRKYEN